MKYYLEARQDDGTWKKLTFASDAGDDDAKRHLDIVIKFAVAAGRSADSVRMRELKNSEYDAEKETEDRPAKAKLIHDYQHVFNEWLYSTPLASLAKVVDDWHERTGVPKPPDLAYTNTKET